MKVEISIDEAMLLKKALHTFECYVCLNYLNENTDAVSGIEKKLDEILYESTKKEVIQ